MHFFDFFSGCYDDMSIFCVIQKSIFGGWTLLKKKETKIEY